MSARLHDCNNPDSSSGVIRLFMFIENRRVRKTKTWPLVWLWVTGPWTEPWFSFYFWSACKPTRFLTISQSCPVFRSLTVMMWNQISSHINFVRIGWKLLRVSGLRNRKNMDSLQPLLIYNLALQAATLHLHSRASAAIPTCLIGDISRLI